MLVCPVNDPRVHLGSARVCLGNDPQWVEQILSGVEPVAAGELLVWLL